ncbi:MAG: peptide ABC transporter substrate-binding protein [Chloroflexi bacterium]|nr:peptide ABC transporter substrate-binding protein [Chloroflexota bacterium]
MTKPNQFAFGISLLILLVFLAACAAPTAEPPKPTALPAATQAPVATTAPVATPVPTTAAPAATSPAATTKGSCGTLRLLWWQASTILNPHLASGSKDWDAIRLVNEPLAGLDVNGKPDVQYGLAAEVPTLENGGIATDGLSITWKLKKNVKWSDGTPFTADDVIFTWQYVTNKDTAASTSTKMSEIKTVEKVDDSTVKVTWNRPNPTPYVAFTGGYGMIIQKKAFENYTGAKAKDAPANLKPIGTGPYIVREFKPNDVVVYDLNPNYRDATKPCFKEVILKGGGDATSAARAVLQTGDADYAWNLQVEADVLQSLMKGGKGKVLGSMSGTLERIAINFSNPDSALGDKRSEPDLPHPFLTDLKVRQALALAVDRQTIGKELYGDGLLGVATCNVVNVPEAHVSTSKHDVCEFNLDKANKLLDDAGWAKGSDGIRQKVVDGKPIKMKLLFQTADNPVRQKTMQIVKQGWEKLGIQVELKGIQSGVFFSNDLANPDTWTKFFADVQLYSQGMSAPDDPIFVANWTCAQIKTKAANWTGRNLSRWCNADYDKLVDQLGNTVDPAKRATIYKQLNDMLVDNVMMIPLVARQFPVIAISNNLKGVVPDPWDSNDLAHLPDWTNK